MQQHTCKLLPLLLLLLGPCALLSLLHCSLQAVLGPHTTHSTLHPAQPHSNCLHTSPDLLGNSLPLKSDSQRGDCGRPPVSMQLLGAPPAASECTQPPTACCLPQVPPGEAPWLPAGCCMTPALGGQ